MNFNGRTVGYAMITPAQIGNAVDEYLATNPNINRQPTAYLYNGVELPALPSAAADYPYLCIYKDADEDLYWLWGSKSPIYIDTSNYGDKVNSTKPCITAHYEPGCTVWDDVHFDLYLGGQFLDAYTFIWCNNQIEKGNAVVHKGSAPVPVYPESGGGSGGGAKVVDFSNYTTADGKTYSRVIQDLVLAGGGSVEVDLTQIFEDATTDGALILKMHVVSADIMIHGVSAFCNMFSKNPEQMGFMVMANMGSGIMSIYVLLDAYTCDGKMTVFVAPITQS